MRGAGRTVAALAVLTAAAAIASGCGGSGRGARTMTCNGSAALCQRRLDQVFFAGTHNSFAAADEPGWRFANQRYGIARQLRDGIRAFLIDVHFGVRDPKNGRVRTDLTAEGSDRNKAAQELSPLALRVADLVAGGVGLGTLKGTPEPYLCHTLCELGSEPLDQELGVIKGFLDSNRDQVVMVVVEDYVPPATIEKSFGQAGLTPYVATLHHGQPLPTLGSLVEQNRRLIVFAEEKGGTPAWYMPAFSFMQDTPLGATRPNQLSCDRYRGEPDSPMLLINHWIPPFPPSTGLNANIGKAAFLRRRVEQCLRDRRVRGAILAVDFYERTSVVDVARELNAHAAG